MKKILILIAALFVTAGVLSAQDINQATELFNNGAMELQMGNTDAAITNFESALKMGEALGAEGEELVTYCKSTIKSATISKAKALFNAKDFAGALEVFNKAKEVAEAYGQADIAAEAAELIAQTGVAKLNDDGRDAMKAKNYEAAVAAFSQLLEADPTNGTAAVQLGQAYMRMGKFAESNAALEVAKANGQEENAVKLISQNFLKLAQASTKAKKYDEAVDYAMKSVEALENANAYKIAAAAYQKLNKNAECIKSYEKYLELSPKAKDAGGVNFTIAALYQQAGNKAKAKEYFEKVVNDPQFGAQAQEVLKTL